ncbi:MULTISPECIES: alpha/beta hydrolase [unclassified Streptomyces]|uniref:alpha/beta hydrolase n=1 Tax=unclassified Streptomyces TaxID=2593676 RepID=UPI002E314A35|nr:alpha/beta hydrolase [Streptomyces sp. NBC_01268]
MDEVCFTAGRAPGLVTAQDGTRIPYERYGDGPPVILVGGGPGEGGGERVLAGLLARRFPVVVYERRGGAGPVEREIGDLALVVDAVGGAAAVHGTASGGGLALAAAAAGVPVGAVSVYEPPYTDGAADGLGRVLARVLVIDGGSSPAGTRRAARTVAAAVPRGRHRTLTGQTDEVAPHVLAPVLAEFLEEVLGVDGAVGGDGRDGAAVGG